MLMTLTIMVGIIYIRGVHQREAMLSLPIFYLVSTLAPRLERKFIKLFQLPAAANIANIVST